MLAKYYRFRILSALDQTLTYNDGARVNLRFLPWKLVSGALSYGTAITDDFGFGAGETIAAAGQEEGSVIDNTSNLYMGGKGFFKVIADLTSSGTVYLYMEESDDNTNWPSDAADFDITTDMILVCALAMSTDANDEDRSKNFEIRV